MSVETKFSATSRLLKLFELSKAVNESIVDDLPGVFAIVDADGRVMRGNRTVAKIIGIHEELLCEHNFAEIFSSAGWSAFQSCLGQLRPGREQMDFQLDIDKDPKPIAYHWNIARAQLAGTGRSYYKIMGHDISTLQQRGRQLEEIYKTLPLGLVTVGLGGTIENVLTEQTNSILNSKNLIGSNIADALFDFSESTDNVKERKGFQQFVASLGNDGSFFQVVRGLFPSMISVALRPGSTQMRHIAISYQPVFKDDILVRALLTLEDRTEAVQMQRERERIKGKDDESVRRILEVKRCPAQLAPLVDKELENFASKITDLVPRRDPRALLNQLHSLKGNSRLAGLASLGDLTHGIETELIEGQKKPSFDLKAFDSRITGLIGEITETRRLMAAVLDVKKRDPAKEASDQVAKSLQKLFKKYNALMAGERGLGAQISAERVDWAIRNSDLSPISEVKDILSNQLNAAANEVGKKVKLVWNAASIKVDQETRAALIEILTHLGTNTLAHGLEETAVRKSLGKPDAGQVSVSISLEGTLLRVLFSDDGRGIDPIAIKLTALKKRLRTAEELNEMREAEILQLIFAAGFSTAKEVTQLSGRGVGLDAVNSIITKHGGRIEVIPNPTGGTDFSFFFKCPGARPIRKSFINASDLHQRMIEAIAYQRGTEQLEIEINPAIENKSANGREKR